MGQKKHSYLNIVKVYFHMYLDRIEEPPIYKNLLTSKEAIALIGPRRAGKTTIAQKLLEDWKKTGVVGKYFDLEAIGAPATIDELNIELKKVPSGGLIVLDEIQVLKDWIKIVREEIEYKKHKIIISGSSASLLSKEIASSLGGRAIPEIVLPISYSDAKKWGLTSITDYLKIGGYPECVLRPYDAQELHKLYLELTVLRDVAARKGIREIKPLLDLALILLSEPGKTISAKKTASAIKISQPTFRSFVDALNDAYLVLSVLPFSRSPREKIVADAKHYAYDVGIQNSISVSTEEDIGRKFENLVAIELIRRGYNISYLKTEKGECDFLAQKIGEKGLAIQVWSGTGNIPERELSGLELGMKVAKSKGLFLTKNKISLERQKKDIIVKTIEDWLLETQ